jgi:hypothetical protein
MSNDTVTKLPIWEVCSFRQRIKVVSLVKDNTQSKDTWQPNVLALAFNELRFGSRCGQVSRTDDNFSEGADSS